MKKALTCSILFLVVIVSSSFLFPPPDPAPAALKLPGGFQVEVIADSLGAARHLAVTSNGIVINKN